MAKDSSLRVRIDGYTDWIGGEDYNMRLSERRANAVKDMLGIAQDRVDVVPHCEGDPIADNETDEGREKNRRATCEVIAADGAR